MNGRFEVACEDGGAYPSSISWPTCKVETCPPEKLAATVIAGFTAVSSGAINVGEFADFACTDSTQARGTQCASS